MRLSFYIFLFLAMSFFKGTFAQNEQTNKLPVKGFCIAAPSQSNVYKFNEFIEKELSTRGVNTLILRVEYNYQYKSHPELNYENALRETDVKKIVKTCHANNIRIIPQINLLGHQSWHGSVGKLLEAYPEFDETPHVELPEKYEWHYERADHTAVYFAMKGFRVATCPWRNPGVAVEQVRNMYNYRDNSTNHV